MAVRVASVCLKGFMLLSLVCAWVIGAYREPLALGGLFGQVLETAREFKRIAPGVCVGFLQEDGHTRHLGYVATASALGYAGPIEVVVGATPVGRITGVVIARQTETPAFFRHIHDSAVLASVIDKHCADPFQVGSDIQAVTGATVSLQGLTTAIQTACHEVARVAQIPIKAREVPRVSVGFPELVLLLLLANGCLISGRNARLWRWIGLGLGLVLVGIWLKRPLSLIHINALLMGYWPQWQTHLYWYLLVLGVLMPIVLTGRNIYCSQICPVGAVQQVLGAASGTQWRVPRRIDQGLRWAQRLLAWLAVCCALAWRNPGILHYEIAGPLFSLNGAVWQFVFLALVLVLSLALVRPWCNYLCPLRVVCDFVRWVRRCVGVFR